MSSVLFRISQQLIVIASHLVVPNLTTKAGCKTPESDVSFLRLGDCPVAPCALLPYLVSASHGLTYISKRGRCDAVSRVWFAPGSHLSQPNMYNQCTHFR
ncbi:hypothetical protein XELAEV_18006364mg [Xenopus laevis]|uniref:Uncharacterized protein n=1 Tax=Xenopus laevis TaxID=8355 RepID=A0A974E018_XENLA|nr:hypothetical protein XELAEV_18006364mg [Xenopus laevis]